MLYLTNDLCLFFLGGSGVQLLQIVEEPVVRLVIHSALECGFQFQKFLKSDLYNVNCKYLIEGRDYK